MMQDIVDTRGGVRCRIPQRLAPTRTKTLIGKTKPQNYEPSIRPKSAGRAKDDMVSNRQARPMSPRAMRPERPPLKRPSTIPKRPNEINKGQKIIMVPVAAKAHGRITNYKGNAGLPDQDTIKKCEALELHQCEYAMLDNGDELDSLSYPIDKDNHLKCKWEDKNMEFEKLKEELVVRQKELLELYACLRDIHNKMGMMGHKAELPRAVDLRVMNVSNLSPGQLLQLCANSDGRTKDTSQLDQIPLCFDVNKLYNMPSKLVGNCEQTLIKRKEIIDWFESLIKQDKGISLSKLSRKINEFTAENDMLTCNLTQIKTEFYNDLGEIVEAVRKSVNETIAIQLQSENLICAMSQLDAKNEDLQKKLQSAEHVKSQNNRVKIEELEKELKEEKSKKMMIRQTLTRAEGQMKIHMERATQLEATLDQARSQNRTLERTVQHLHDQNQKLQVEFDTELSKLNESIKQNTSHLEEIANAREKLQTEKEQLEKRIEDLSAYYNQSLESMKSEMNSKVVKLIETDERCQLEINENKQLEDKISSLCAQLMESQLKCKDLQKELQENEALSSKFEMSQNELETTRYELEIANNEINEYKNKLLQQNEQINKLEQKCTESFDLQEGVKRDLLLKEESIKELESKKIHLEQQIQDSKSIMDSYEQQLIALRNQLKQLQEDFGDFENISELCEMVSEQKEKLLQRTRQNEELIDLLQNKEAELEHHTKSLVQKDHLLEKKNDFIKVLTGKEEEQANIIKLLRNNLELRTHGDSKFQQQLAEKDTEIEKLVTSLNTRKQQITELEKIILTLEEQSQKSKAQIEQLETIIISLQNQSRKDRLEKRKGEELLAILENKIQEYESYCTDKKRQQDVETPSENLDSLIKVLENELGMPLQAHSNREDREYNMTKRKYDGDRKVHDKERIDGEPPIYFEAESMPTKTIRHYGRRHYFAKKEDHFGGDNLGRKHAITKIDSSKNAPEIGMKVYPTPPTNQDFKRVIPAPKNNIITRNIGFYAPDKLQEDKKYKMFKLAGHRL